MKRTTYLDVVDLKTAKEALQASFLKIRNFEVETIPVANAYGRMTAEPVFARISNPHYNASAMDGISLDAKVTFGAHEKNPVTLKEGIDFKYVDTGDCVQNGHNAVVMIEDVYPKEDGAVELIQSVYPWENVRVVGEDIAVGDMILPSMHTMGALDLGALISGGITELSVKKRQTVGIIPTGTEIVNPGSKLKPGHIIDSNSYVFEAMVKEAGGIPKRYSPVPDDRELLKAAFLKAAEENDMVVINAGSSAGSEDYTVGLIRELGEVKIHGIAIKPGKPTIIGTIKGKPVIGIPGYPVSAFISFKEFVIPLLTLERDTPSRLVEVQLSKRIVSSLKHQEFVRMKIGKVNDQFIGTALARGAGATMSLVKADGILSIPKNVEGYEAGQIVQVNLLKDPEILEKSLVSIGSHDIIMDTINDLMSKDEKGFTLSSAHVGSLGGILATRRKETHVAPVHLLDEETGQYNVPYIKRYLSDETVYLLKGIKRWQGFYVPKGNPNNITTFEDLVHKEVVFANRQKGSGTRMLLEYHMHKDGIDPAGISGFKKEYTTHTNVALAVLAGNADVGLGIQSVANLMGLDFVPLALEDYDFIVPKPFMEDPRVRAFLSTLQSEAFKDALDKLGGYRFDKMEWTVIKND